MNKEKTEKYRPYREWPPIGGTPRVCRPRPAMQRGPTPWQATQLILFLAGFLPVIMPRQEFRCAKTENAKAGHKTDFLNRMKFLLSLPPKQFKGNRKQIQKLAYHIRVDNE